MKYPRLMIKRLLIDDPVESKLLLLHHTNNKYIRRLVAGFKTTCRLAMQTLGAIRGTFLF